MAGIAFYLYPNYVIFSHGFITLIDIAWKLYMTSNDLQKPKILMAFNKLPIARILFTILFGILSHIRIFQPWLSTTMLRRLIALTTNHRYLYKYILIIIHIPGIFRTECIIIILYRFYSKTIKCD